MEMSWRDAGNEGGRDVKPLESRYLEERKRDFSEAARIAVS
jgi:hypothetical protein